MVPLAIKIIGKCAAVINLIGFSTESSCSWFYWITNNWFSLGDLDQRQYFSDEWASTLLQVYRSPKITNLRMDPVSTSVPSERSCSQESPRACLRKTKHNLQVTKGSAKLMALRVKDSYPRKEKSGDVLVWLTYNLLGLLSANEFNIVCTPYATNDWMTLHWHSCFAVHSIPTLYAPARSDSYLLDS